MTLLDIFRRPERARPERRKRTDTDHDSEPLPAPVEPPTTASGSISQDSLPNRASEEDAA